MKNRPWLTRALPAFTLLFAAVCLVGYSPLWAQGRTFIWSADGRTQFFPFLLYTQRWIAQGLPSFDFSLGMGEDVLATFIFMSPCDPLSLLFGLLARLGSAEFWFMALSLLRLYLAGLGFLYFCRDRGAQPAGAVCGAMVYLFCGYAALMSTQCSTFSIPMMYLPLLLAGFDRILRGGRPWLFLAVVFYAGVTGFYFLYMCSVALAVYGVARGLTLYGRRLAALLRAVLRGVLWYLAGLGLAAPVLVPVVRGYLSSSRTVAGGKPDDFLFAGAEQAKALLAGLFGSRWGFEYPGLCAIALAALVLLCTRRGHPALRAVCLLATALIFCPAFGYLMNGFGYVTWRWTFLFAFVMAWAVALQWDRLTHVRWFEPLFLAAAALAYLVLGGGGPAVLLAAAAMAVTAAALWLVRRNPRLAPVLVAVVAVNAAANLWMHYSPLGGNYAAEFLKQGEWYQRQQTPWDQFETLRSDDGFYRLDQPTTNKNASWPEGWQGVGIFNSVLNGAYCSTMLDWELTPVTDGTYDFLNLDRRATLETVCGVKYMILPSGDSRVPAGFAPVEEQGGYTLYQNRYAAPLGTVYTQTISAPQVNDFSSLERQQLMLRAAALNDAAPADDPATGCVYLDCTVDWQNAQWENGFLHAGDNATLTITAPMEEEGEVCLRFNGFAAYNFISDLTAECGGVQQHARLYNTVHGKYFPTDGVTICFGTQAAGTLQVTMQFQAGDYSLGGIQLWAVPTAVYEQDAASYAANAIGFVSRGRDTLTLRTDSADAGWAVTTIPYSTGWRVEVDGVPAATQTANGMFLAFPVEGGSHTVTLRYRSPGRRTGNALLLLTLGCLLLRVLWLKKRGGPAVKR